MTYQTDVLIAGGGPAGIAAAIWCKRLGLDHLLLESGDELGGQLQEIQNEIIDYPGSLAGNGLVLKERFADQVNKLDCIYKLNTRITSICSSSSSLSYSTPQSMHNEIQFKFLVLATGSSPKHLRVPGEEQMIKRGEVYSATRDSSRFSGGRRVAVIGGGDRAFEGALLLAEQGALVHLIHRSRQFRARRELREPVLHHSQIKIHTNTQVIEIYNEMKLEGIKIRDEESNVKALPVEAVFIRIGAQPNSHLVRKQVNTDQDGYIVVDNYGQTSAKNIYAIGDVCTRPSFSSISTGVGQAMLAVKQISLFLGND